MIPGTKALWQVLWVWFAIFPIADLTAQEIIRVTSPDASNVCILSTDHSGQIHYRIERHSATVIETSPLGLRGEKGSFESGLTVIATGKEKIRREQYTILSGNRLKIDQTLHENFIEVRNRQGDSMIIDLAASNEGVGLRYRFKDQIARTITQELTGFTIPQHAIAWMQPYHSAGRYTPAYEDFYFRVQPGDQPPRSRQDPRGWCLPALFNLDQGNSWVLISETGIDSGYCAGHLENDPNQTGRYQIALAYEDERTAARRFNTNAKPAGVLASQTPWRLIILGDKAGDILMSTLTTDLAAPSQIKDTSWIQTGRASWAWWSHPDGPATEALFNDFTDLAAEFGWEYTLFDAGWWTPGLAGISDYARSKKIKPLAWVHAQDFYDDNRRERKLEECAGQGAKGVKIDFWCSDRQEAMAAIEASLRACARRKLVVNLHGCTIPRGWLRTWPNLLTAEAVLGTESYFYESRYPQKAAELNTILPFTRNVSAPMDTTPIALTIRKYPRQTTAAHELATSIIFSSGLIHYADSAEMFRSLPDAVRKILIDTPAAWDETRCLIGEPGRLVILARRTGAVWYVAGINGTDKTIPADLDLNTLGSKLACLAITEGPNPLMDFTISNTNTVSRWQSSLPPYGGLVLRLHTHH